MKRATYQDVLDAPENKVAEILDGELFLSPRPAPRHAVASSRLGFLIGGPFDQTGGGPGGWWILDEPELHLGEHVVVPDLAGWRRERMPAIPEEAFFSLAPDWVCEVLSPSTARIDRGRKLRIYAAAGVAHAWFVNPLERTLEVLVCGKVPGRSWRCAPIPTAFASSPSRRSSWSWAASGRTRLRPLPTRADAHLCSLAATSRKPASSP
jgi:Uma2 family endonuclease